jgi:hypothetical protein
MSVRMYDMIYLVMVGGCQITFNYGAWVFLSN